MRKKYGQNFLINPRARKALLDALDAPAGETVWEIGGGLGAMTAGLLERGAKVTVFEIDKGFIAALEEFFGLNPDFTLVPGDVMKTWKAAAQTGETGDYLLGNLPYTIAASLLADFIERGRFFKRMVVTVQKETARRMGARPGTPDYSSFSVLCASVYHVQPLLVLKGASFYPEPRVDSQGVLLEKRDDVDPRAYPRYFRPLVRALFSSRRKTVRNNLGGFIASLTESGGSARELAPSVLEAAGIPANERAERLGIGEFCALASALETLLPPAAPEVPRG
jgi:16S rRNA (adenine1518-N6/adenine1519-N6)-dimethyltransferase